MSSNPLTIGIDLDDVLLDFNSSLCVFHNQKYGTNYKREEIHSYHFEDVWGIPSEQVIERISDFYHSELHWSSSPIIGAAAAIQKLQKKHKLIIVTAKPDYLRDKTQIWLDMHYPEAFKEIHFTGHFHANKHGPKRTKVEVCDEVGIDIFIEDSIDNARKIARAHRPVLLIDSPWNQGELPENVRRVRGWEEVLEILG